MMALMAVDAFEFTAALIREQKTTFAVVEVPPTVLGGGEKAAHKERDKYEPIFKGVPIVLATKGTDGRPRYYGRPDIVRFLTSVGWSRIPWKKYRVRKKDKNPFRDWA